MATLSPQFFQLLEAEEKMIVMDSFEAQPANHERIFATKNSTKAYEDRLRIAKLGTFVQKNEGTPISFDDPVQGTQVRTVHQTFGLGFRTTEEMMEDDQFDVMRNMAADLGESAADHRQRLAWGLVNDGFTGTTYTGLEGDVLFTNAHTLLKVAASGTGVRQNDSNILDPAVALSLTGIETMMTQISLLQSEEGRFIDAKGKTLVVPPELQHQAYVLLEAEFRPGSSDNDPNTGARTRNGWEILVSPYLSSTSNWFVFSEPSEKRLVWNDRRPLKFFRNNDADTGDQKFGATYRASVMFSEWRGSWASQS